MATRTLKVRNPFLALERAEELAEDRGVLLTSINLTLSTASAPLNDGGYGVIVYNDASSASDSTRRNDNKRILDAAYFTVSGSVR